MVRGHAVLQEAPDQLFKKYSVSGQFSDPHLHGNSTCQPSHKAGGVLGRFGAKKWYDNFTHYSEVMPLLSFEVWFSTQEKASCDCVN